MFAWSLVGRGGKLGIAAPAAPTASNHHPFVDPRKVVDHFSGFLVVDDGSDGNLQENVLAFLPVRLEPSPWRPRCALYSGLKRK